MAKAKRPASPIAATLRARRDVLFDLASPLPQLVELDVGAIQPNPHQPRREVDEAALAELAASIERHGLLQPIIVAAAGTGYVLVAGQRRWLAHRRLGRERIPALLTTGAVDELALIENLQREDLSPLDEAAALAALKERHGYGLDQLAKALAKAKSTVSELLSLTRIAPSVQDAIRTAPRPPSKSLLIELARIEGEAAQRAWWEDLDRGQGATVRAARARRQSKSPNPAKPAADLAGNGRRLLAGLEGVTGTAVRRDAAAMEVLRRLHDRIGRILAG